METNEKAVWNVSGGQINIAHDQGVVHAIQYNSERSNELGGIIKNIEDDIIGRKYP